MRLVKTFSTLAGNTAKVYRDSEWDEYRVKFFKEGKHLKDADYHTSDRQDALDTARYQLERGLT